MAFREPLVIEHGLPVPPGPNIRDDPVTMARLAKKWDDLDLLVVHREDIPRDSLVRIFGALKSSEVHRQIGDKRGRNAMECKVPGPSSDLPSGVDLCDLYIDPSSSSLLLSITDRRDFYHQLEITQQKAITNTIGPAIPTELTKDTKAFSAFILGSTGKKYDRIRQGDRLERDAIFGSRVEYPVAPLNDCECWTSFRSVLQGDHIGVEVATDSHLSLLASAGLLCDEERMTASRPLRSTSNASGLVIDDFFTISTQPKGQPAEESQAYRHYQKAQEVYRKSGLLGSPQKDLIAVPSGKAIGAFVNASTAATDRGLVTVAAPSEKRLALSYITLQICQIGFTTDSLHLCIIGGWVSVLGYRRMLMAILQESFHLVDPENYDRLNPKVLKLPSCQSWSLWWWLTYQRHSVTASFAQMHPMRRERYFPRE